MQALKAVGEFARSELAPEIDTPVYTPAAAARYLRLPVSSIRWWTLGNGAHFPVIRIAAPDEQLLSFRNLIEVHVLSAVMCHDRNRVPLAIAREVLVGLQAHLHSSHPLSEPGMHGEGRELFARTFGALLNSSRHGQLAIASILGSYLDRIERDARGVPRRLFVFTRGRPDGPAHVMIDPLVQSGQPCISGTAVTTAIVAARFKEGSSVADLEALYGCPREQIEEAIRYETDPR